MEFSEKLKQLRQKKGISQARLAEEIHISRSAVAKWENGLGLPNEESLKLLAEFFEIDVLEFLPDKEKEETLIAKNRTIASQEKWIIGLLIGVAIGLLLLGYVFIEPLRDNLMLIAFGVVFIVLGGFNMKGNIASIHWYNRRKVTEEDQLPYCKLVGLGTIIIGVAMIVSALFQAAVGTNVGTAMMLPGILIGLILILVAQFKYNKGLF